MGQNAVGTATEVSVRRKVKDGWHVYTCDQLPGLYVAHPDDRIAYNDVPGSIAALLRLNYGMECVVAHKVPYHDFIRMSDLDGARGVLEERTQELIDSQVDQYFQFTLQQVKQLSRWPSDESVPCPKRG
jgi:hypothetical protein